MPEPRQPSRGKKSTDWAEVRTRLQHSDAPTATRSDSAVLQQRARELAQPITQLETIADQQAKIILFELGGQTFGLETSAIREVLDAPELTPLPGTPVHVKGLANIRSQVVPVFDIGPVLPVPESPDGGPTKLVIITFDAAVFAILAHQILGVRELSAISGRRETHGLNTQYIANLTADGLIVLDVPALAAALTIEDAPPR